MAGLKSYRMGENIKRIISAKMKDLKDPRISKALMLTIVRCEVSSDGSYCKVYVSSLEGIAQAKAATEAFEGAKGILKREISNVLHLRKCPELKFCADDSIEYGAKINELLKDE